MNPLLTICISEWDGGWPCSETTYRRYMKLAWTKDPKTWSLRKIFSYYVEKKSWDVSINKSFPELETYEIRRSEFKKSTSEKIWKMYNRMGKIIKVR